MLIRRHKWALVAALLGVFLFIDYMITPGSCINRYAQEHEIKEDSPYDKCPAFTGLIFAKFAPWVARVAHTHDKEIVALATFVIALFTIGLTASTIMLWRAGERHAERQLRAYLSVVRGDFQLIGPNKSELNAHIILKNSGQTPAYDVSVSTYCEIWDVPNLGAEYRAVTPVEQREAFSVLGSGVEFIVDEPWKGPGKADIPDINSGMKKIYAWGEVNYRDAFGKNRWLRFRLTQGRMRPDNSGWPIAPCKEGNDAN